MKRKKIFSIVLATLMLLCSLTVTAFADEPDDDEFEIPEGATVYTFDFTVQPAPETNETEPGISPQMWDHLDQSISANDTYLTPSFSVPERYFAFEVWVTRQDGQLSSGSYSVTVSNYGFYIFGASHTIDGVNYKHDWIDFQRTNNSVAFVLGNTIDQPITFHITCYSWS